MKKWKNEWKDEKMMNEWINKWMNERKEERMDESMNGRKDESMNQWINEWINGWIPGLNSSKVSLSENTFSASTDLPSIVNPRSRAIFRKRKYRVSQKSVQ